MYVTVCTGGGEMVRRGGNGGDKGRGEEGELEESHSVLT